MNALPITARNRRMLGARGGIGIALAAMLLTSACAAGQLAQTSNTRSSIDGVNASVGHMDLRGLALQAPAAAPYYPVGSNISFKVVIVNSGKQLDKLVGIKATTATDWVASGKQASATGSKSVSIAAGNRVGYGVPTNSGTLMLRGTKQELYPGTSVPITFTFARAGSVRVVVPVQLRAASANASIEAPKDAVGD